MEVDPVLFTGESEHAIDGKLRLAIPAKYRHQWSAERDGGAWYCLPWPMDHLRIFTETGFTQMATGMRSSLAPHSKLAEMQLSMFSSAERLEMDSAGRIAIPRRHIDRVKLGTEVIVAGAGDRLEVWNKAQWETMADERWAKLQDRADEQQKG